MTTTSGVKCSKSVEEICKEMQLPEKSKNPDGSPRIAVFKIDFTEMEIVVSSIHRSKSLMTEGNIYKTFSHLFTDIECCYALYDCHYETNESSKNDLVFIMWAPDGASIKHRMVYASSKPNMLSQCNGAKHKLERQDLSDLEIRNFAKDLGKDIVAIEGQRFTEKGSKKH